MVARTNEAALLGAPERKAHVTMCLGQLLSRLQRGFKHRGRTAAIVIDAGSLRNAVEMCADHDPWTIVANGCFGHDVAGWRFPTTASTARRTVVPVSTVAARELPNIYEMPTTGIIRLG